MKKQIEHPYIALSDKGYELLAALCERTGYSEGTVLEIALHYYPKPVERPIGRSSTVIFDDHAFHNCLPEGSCIGGTPLSPIFGNYHHPLSCCPTTPKKED